MPPQQLHRSDPRQRWRAAGECIEMCKMVGKRTFRCVFEHRDVRLKRYSRISMHRRVQKGCRKEQDSRSSQSSREKGRQLHGSSAYFRVIAGSKRCPIRSGMTKTVIAGLLSASLLAPTGNLSCRRQKMPDQVGHDENRHCRLALRVIAGPDRQSFLPAAKDARSGRA